ncbi:MAG: hypothetical protein ABIE92_07710, partial [bacterium]
MTDLLICINRSDFPAEIPHDFYLPQEAPTVLAGPVDLLKRPRFTILNSRQSPRLSKDSEWAKKTLELLRSLDPKEAVLVSSLGTTAWDFLSWAGARLGFPVILVFPGGSALNFKVVRTKAIMNLGLDDAKTLAIRPLLLKKYKNKLEKNALRDHWVFALSQKYNPVSVRQGGNLDKRLQHPSLPEDAINLTHALKYKPAEPKSRIAIPEKDYQPDDFDAKQYLIHWTRICIGPWPDESTADYFSRTINEAEDQDGFATLKRIINEKRIRASNRLIRGGYQVVPFTARPPEALAELVKWRSGLRRWTFEPYGLAVNKEKLEEMGARPVIYGNLAKFDALSEEDKPFFQLEGSGKHDWREEREWRLSGDLDLGKFNRSEIAAITYRKEEANTIQKNKKIK